MKNVYLVKINDKMKIAVGISELIDVVNGYSVPMQAVQVLYEDGSVEYDDGDDHIELVIITDHVKEEILKGLAS